MDKKITFFIFSLRHGGAEKVCLTLCNEFAKRNYQTELWIVDNSETTLTKMLDKQVLVFALNKKHVRNTFLPIMKLLRRRKPARLIIFNIELAILVIILKKILILNTQIIVRSINTLSQAFTFPKTIWEKYIAKKAIRRLLIFSDKIIAQSTGMKNDLIKTFHIPEKKIVTIHNPSTLIAPVKSVQLEPSENEFLYVGRLSPQKGLMNLIEAFRRTYEKNKNIRLTIVGDGSEKEKLVALTEQLSLTNNIKFEGYKSSTEPYFERAKATLLTSNFEGFPNVLVESISRGTPVISFDCPSGPSDIIEQGVNGLLIPHLDVEGFSKALLAVANGEIRFNHQDVVSSSRKFSTENIIAKYEQVIFNES